MAAEGTYHIAKLDPATLKTDRAYLLVGRKGSGKTTLMKHIMYLLRDQVDYAIAMTPTEDTVRDFLDFLPPFAVHRAYKPQIVKDLMDYIDAQQAQGRDMGVIGILMDDCTFEKKIMNSELMRRIYMNGRHYRFLAMNLMQYVMDMPVPIRSNCDYVFAMYDPIRKNRERLYENFFGVFASFEEFDATVNVIRAKHPRACIVIDNTNGGQSVEDSVFWYVAEPVEKRFCVGSRDFWKLGHLAAEGRLRPPALALAASLQQNLASSSAAAAPGRGRKRARTEVVLSDAPATQASAGPAPGQGLGVKRRRDAADDDGDDRASRVSRVSRVSRASRRPRLQ